MEVHKPLITFEVGGDGRRRHPPPKRRRRPNRPAKSRVDRRGPRGGARWLRRRERRRRRDAQPPPRGGRGRRDDATTVDADASPSRLTEHAGARSALDAAGSPLREAARRRPRDTGGHRPRRAHHPRRRRAGTLGCADDDRAVTSASPITGPRTTLEVRRTRARVLGDGTEGGAHPRKGRAALDGRSHDPERAQRTARVGVGAT